MAVTSCTCSDGVGVNVMFDGAGLEVATLFIGGFGCGMCSGLVVCSKL